MLPIMHVYLLKRNEVNASSWMSENERARLKYAPLILARVGLSSHTRPGNILMHKLHCVHFLFNEGLVELKS